MKVAFSAMLAALMLFAGVATVSAEDDKKSDAKEVTLKGDIGCPKCNAWTKGLKGCANAVKFKDGDKDVVVIFDDKGKKEAYHNCTNSKPGSVTGVYVGSGDKKKLKPAKDGVKFE